MSNRSVPLLDDLILLTRSVRAAFEQRVKRVDLTYARARLLTAIGRKPGASQTELAAMLEIETPTLKRLLDALEAQGLAQRRPLDGDARKHAVFLTETTRTEPLLRFRDEIETALTVGVSARDMAVTRRVLKVMTQNAEQMRQP